MVETVKIIGAYDITLIFVGTIANFIIFVVSLKLTQNTTFIFLLYLSVTDTVALYFWNLNHFLTAYFQIDLQNLNVYWCKIGHFYQISSLHISAWLLVMVSFDRYFSVAISGWKRVYFQPKRAFIAATAVVIFFAGINTNILFLYGVEYHVNETIKTVCYSSTPDPATYWMGTWYEVYSILYSYVPFCLLATANALLIGTLYWRTRTSKAQTLTKAKKQRAMNRTVISISLIFILMTAFITIGSLFYPSLIQSYTGLCILFFCDSVGFSYHGLNFFILLFTNKKFRQQLGLLIGKDLTTHKVSAQHANSNTQQSVAKNSNGIKHLTNDDE